MRSADGTYRWISSVARDLRSDESAPFASVVATWRDVQAAVEAEQRLAESEIRYRLLAEHAGDIIVELDIEGSITYVTPSVTTVLGWTPEDLLGHRLSDWLYPDDREDVAFAVAASQQTNNSVSARARLRRPDGTYTWIGGVQRAIRDQHGSPTAAVAILRDIQSEIETQDTLARQATTDALTGLLNRRGAIKALTPMLTHMHRPGAHVALLYLDLDGLKGINDERGHAAGDLLLTTTATRLAHAVREGDMIARVGGDELVIVVDGVRDMTDAANVAEKVRAAIAIPIPSRTGPPIASTASIGVTLARPGEDPDTLIQRADRAMYRAKHEGGNRAVLA